MRRIDHRRTPAVALLAATALALSLLLPTAAQAAAPGSATLVTPVDGGTTASVTPTLSVQAADPDGGSLDVTFEGREAGATVPGDGVPGDNGSEPFSVVIVPDTQNYSYANQAILDTQLAWVRDSREALGTAFVIQLGDLVSEWDIPAHWTSVSTAFGALDAASVPYSVLPGNHDFDTATGDVSVYNAHFPPSRFAQAAWSPSSTRYGGYLGQDQFGADPVDRGNADNYALFSAGGRDFLVLNLEWEAPQYALDWAERVMDAHPDRIVIMATHSFLSVTGGRSATPQRPGGTSTAELWQEFVHANCRIRLVVAGHASEGDLSEARRTDANACGQPVHQILTDYQDRANGGNGWLRYYTFDPAAGTMTASTYSPSLATFETDASSSFTLPFELAATQPAPFAPIATQTVASGSSASATWSGLSHDTEYEWRAVVDDGVTRTTSATWSLRTPPEPQSVLIEDSFTRTVSPGWGAADVGGPWSMTAGSSQPLSVGGGQGRMSLPRGTTRITTLSAVSTDDALIEVDVGAGQASVGGASHATIIGRQIGSRHYGLIVRFETGGQLRLYLVRDNTALGTRVATWAPGQALTVRLAVTGTGTTQLAASVWPAGGTAPAAWQMTASDSTASLQGAGTIALKGAVSSSSSVAVTQLAFDDLRVTSATAEPPVNAPPVARFTSSSSDLTVSADATASTDADGTIAGYAWDLGDGTTASGPTVQHTYGAAGAYAVALTVTDDDGATASTSRTVTVTAPEEPPGGVVAADTFSRSASGGWGVAELGGAWSTTSGSGLSVAGGQGLMTLARSQTRQVALASTSTADAVVEVTVASDIASAGGAAQATIIGRQVGSAHYGLIVRFEPGGVLRLYLVRDNTALASRTMAWSPGQPLAVRLQVSGTSPTQLAASVWVAGGTAPAAWQLTGTDSTAGLQQGGTLALKGAVSASSTVAVTRLSFDDYRVTGG